MWVSTRSDSVKVYVEFTDSGPGVQEASRVFDPFYTTKPVGKGTGLGLSICYGIVTEHGGTIRVRNLQHRGASFTIELPYGLAVTEQAAEAQSGSSGKELLALCIDPDDEVLHALEEILSAHGYQVRSACNAKEVRALIDKYQFDAIVTDINIRDAGSSKTILDWLIDYRPTLSQFVIRTSASSSSSDATEPSLTRDSALLKKPIVAAQLLDAVDALVSVRVQPAAVER